MKRKYDDNYIQHCLDDLEKARQILKDEDNIQCIVELINDYKKFEVE